MQQRKPGVWAVPSLLALLGLGAGIPPETTSSALLPLSQTTTENPVNCSQIQHALANPPAGSNADVYWLYGCAAMSKARWLQIMAGFTYGAAVGSACPKDSKYFVDLFKNAWSDDTFKIEFDSLYNASDQTWVNGVHAKGHELIGVKDNYGSLECVHEALHHEDPTATESVITQRAIDLERDCYRVPPPPPSSGGGGGSGPTTVGYWVFIPATYKEKCLSHGGTTTCTYHASGAPDGGAYYHCAITYTEDVCWLQVVTRGSWVWVEETI